VALTRASRIASGLLVHQYSLEQISVCQEVAWRAALREGGESDGSQLCFPLTANTIKLQRSTLPHDSPYTGHSQLTMLRTTRRFHTLPLKRARPGLGVAYAGHGIQRQSQSQSKFQAVGDLNRFQRFSTTRHWGEGRSTQLAPSKLELPEVGG
jgi:hypothetical protein